ncbi:MAG: pseudouridine synthase [bacterium]
MQPDPGKDIRESSDDRIRLHKHLASCGVASRRKAEALIAAGRVSVNSRPVSDRVCLIDPLEDRVDVDGVSVKPERLRTFAIHKPPGVLCTAEDPQGRPIAAALLPDMKERLYCVGRLDADSEGLLLMTNDGAFAQRVMHPSGGVLKVYHVTTSPALSAEGRQAMTVGIRVDGETLRAGSVAILEETPNKGAYRITLAQGRKREIRRMVANVGSRAVRLVRVAIGGLELGDRPAGTAWELTPDERDRVFRAG